MDKLEKKTRAILYKLDKIEYDVEYNQGVVLKILRRQYTLMGIHASLIFMQFALVVINALL